VADRPARKLVGVYMPYEDWEKLVLLAYIYQPKNRDSGNRSLASSKSKIMVEAFEEYLRNHPELEKNIERARQAFHIEEGEKA
jgi:hypothetical protein